MKLSEDKVFSVGEFIEFLNIGLKSSKAKIMGEVVEVQAGPTGHIYFTLKDGKAQATLNCVIWKYAYNLYGIKLEQGMKIIIFGNPNIYPPSGRLSFIAEMIEVAGEGALKKQYDELKRRLEKEGIFDAERKRIVPKYPQKVGLITAKQGAVISDFLNNIGKFGYKIKMIDSRVEGQEAVKDLLASIKRFKKEEIDLLVLIRGGGSLESLMAFNNEILVREVSNFPVPVIVGIGHDKDVPLVALAADVAVSTPTAVANLLNRSWEQLILYLEREERNIITRYDNILDKYKEIENRLKFSCNKYENALLNISNRPKNCLKKSLFGFGVLFFNFNQKLEQIENLIFSKNPERLLSLGYSITKCGGKIVRQINDVEVGKEIETKILDEKKGKIFFIVSKVKDIIKNNE